MHHLDPKSLGQDGQYLHARTQALKSELEQDQAVICIPTICVSEFLAGCNPDETEAVVKTFSENFECPSFNIAAASVAAKIFREAKGGKKDQYANSRKVLTADCKIIAIACVNNIQRIYSSDAGFRNLAKKYIRDVRDVPKHSRDLFENQNIINLKPSK